MGLIAPAVRAAGFGPAMNDGYWLGGAQWGDGVPLVTADDALGVAAFYAGVALISEDMGKVPVRVLEDLGDLGSRETSNHPIGELLEFQPNEHQTAFEFKEMMTAWAIMRPFAIAEISPGPRGAVDRLTPLHPGLVAAQRDSAGVRYRYLDPKQDGKARFLRPDEVFVLRGRLGRSVLDYAGQSLSVDAAIERYAGVLFARGARPQAVVQHPAQLSEPGRQNLRKVLDEYSIAGPRSGRPMLLEEGLTWQDVGLTNKDAEFMENRKWSVRQASRWLRIPPHKLGDMSDATYSNVEQENINYVTDTLLSWAIRWEQAIRRDLVVAKGRFFARFNLDVLLRGDAHARAQAYALAVQWGWMTRNEARAREGMNPIPGLDQPLTPLNMVTGPGQPGQQARLSPAAAGHLRLLAADAADRVVRRERDAVAKAADRSRGDQGAFARELEAFYAAHADHVAGYLHIPKDSAMAYASRQLAAARAGSVPDGASVSDLVSIVSAAVAA